jgi:hypothetical protein
VKRVMFAVRLAKFHLNTMADCKILAASAQLIRAFPERDSSMFGGLLLLVVPLLSSLSLLSSPSSVFDEKR